MPVTTDPARRLSARHPASSGRTGGALTGTGAVVVASLGTAIGVIAASVTGDGLGVLFTVLFVTGCLVATARVRRAELRTALVMVPLVFLGALVLADLLSPSPGGTSWVTSQASTVATNLVVHAPSLFAGVAASAAVAAIRRWVAHR